MYVRWWWGRRNLTDGRVDLDCEYQWFIWEVMIWYHNTIFIVNSFIFTDKCRNWIVVLWHLQRLHSRTFGSRADASWPHVCAVLSRAWNGFPWCVRRRYWEDCDGRLCGDSLSHKFGIYNVVRAIYYSFRAWVDSILLRWSLLQSISRQKYGER